LAAVLAEGTTTLENVRSSPTSPSWRVLTSAELDRGLGRGGS